MTTLKHRMVNRIFKLNANGDTMEDEEIIKREATYFFSNLLQGDPNLDNEK